MTPQLPDDSLAHQPLGGEAHHQHEIPPEIPQRSSWQSRLLTVSFAIFAFEIGLFLVLFPWMGEAWDLNYFQSGQVLRNLWDEPYFRGAVSGVGFVNIYIALMQIGRLFRRSA